MELNIGIKDIFSLTAKIRGTSVFLGSLGVAVAAFGGWALVREGRLMLEDEKKPKPPVSYRNNRSEKS